MGNAVDAKAPVRPAASRIVLLFAAALAACAPPARAPVPEQLVTQARLPGYSGIRYWADDAASMDGEDAAERLRQLRAAGNIGHREFLAISGGGSNGAFGAGILVGWTDSGKRPEFETVTGVSTGSLSAPFAYLGKPWDARLRDSYTKVSGAQIYRKQGLLRIFDTAAVTDNTPLRRLVDDYVTDEMVRDIARQQALGRRLYVLTTDLDAGRPVAWNIGAIAASDQPARKELIQDLLVASAAIPGVFPPVRIQVVADGVAYDELHVDGSTSKAAFFLPRNFSEVMEADGLGMGGGRNTLYVIRNGRVDPEYKATKDKLSAVVGRSISVLLFNAAIDNLYELYTTAQSVGFRFNAVWVPASFTMIEPTPFDPAYMQALYDVGFQMGAKGDFWSDYPPR